MEEEMMAIDPLPLVGKQQHFFEDTADVTAFTGPRAIGKTHALLRCGLRYAAIKPVTGFDGLILTMQPAELMTHISDTSRFLGIAVPRLNHSQRTASWPDYQTRLTFLQIRSQDDMRALQGRIAHFVGIDNLDRFSPDLMYMLLKRLRPLNNGLQPTMRITFSQEDPAPSLHSWAWRFFSPWLNPDHPAPVASGEVRYFKDVHLLESDHTVWDMAEWPTADPQYSLSYCATVISFAQA